MIKEPFASLQALPDAEREIFELRLERSRADLFGPLDRLYSHLPGYEDFRARLLDTLARRWAERSPALKRLDLSRDLEPDWFLREGMVGYVFYIDRFAGKLRDVLDHVDYLEELGVTYLHLMPCLKPREGDNDGGYSVQDYRAINPAYGTMEDFTAVTSALRQRGISVCVDLVVNHTAKEHAWALAARRGSERHQAYYRMFDDDTVPKAYERTLLEVFPDQAPGNFTWYDDLGKWVWTTFNEHQWDLNWENPEVFLEFADIMLDLANRGAEVFRLDAVAFMWKRLGTISQNEPEVHQILQGLRAVCRIGCAAVIHKAEAIVAPGDLIPYLGTGQHTGKVGNLAYHNSLMVQFWSALASRETDLMEHVLSTHFPAGHHNATWATYLRCHDDIGWAITEEDAGALGLSGPAHRSFLAEFYEGSFEGSFAKGWTFQYNPETNDKRTNGTLASLCGLERAVAADDPTAISTAIERILMGHALIASWGGIPLIYMGDEIGLLNDYDFARDGETDSRWIHRPFMDWDAAARRADRATIEGRIFSGVQRIMQTRKATPHFHGSVRRTVLDSPGKRLFAFRRNGMTGPMVCVFNFSETVQELDLHWFESNGATSGYDVLSQMPLQVSEGRVAIPPYGALWTI